MEKSAKRRYPVLPLIASPLKHDDQQQGQGVPTQTNRPCSFSDKRRSIISVIERSSESQAFREREEASSIELFFDLFFVANLTSFTTVHPIDDRQTILSYIGFFAILWFSWLQVVLFDVRFGVDSLFERVAKLIHFGVMITFAIVGTRFDPSRRMETHVTMKQMSIVLLVSRVVLIAQYASVMLWVRGNKKILTPLAMHIVAFAVGAILCLGFFFTFTLGSSGQAYIVWYIIIVLEALAVFFISSHWPTVGFKYTNLNERCGLLTLIILGEGIIVLTKSMNYLVQGENFSRSIIAQIISAVLIIYSTYLLYFDQFPHPPSISLPHSSSNLHHAWTLAHFPFHIALILLMEGTSRLITWRNALEIVTHILNAYSDIYNNNLNSSALTLSHDLGNFSAGVLQSVDADPTKFNVTGYLRDLRYAGDPNGEEAMTAAWGVVVVLVNAVFKFFHIQSAKRMDAPVLMAPDLSGEGGSPDPYDDLGSALDVYDLVFVYFFVAAGCTVFLLAMLMALGNWDGRSCSCEQRSWWTRLLSGYSNRDAISMAIRVIGGIGLALVAV
ncbi:MAG: hypothetical protein Q9170_005694, partial [Blastenia crenularia]